MIARAIEELAVELRALHSRAVWNATLALAALLAAPLAAVYDGALAAALVAGGLVEAVLALGALIRHHELVALAAGDPDAHAIGAVRRYAAALNSQPIRSQMAATLRGVAAEPPLNPRLEPVIRAHRAELCELADDLEDPETNIPPTTVVAISALVNGGSGSPLFDPTTPSGELHSALLRIHAGIRHGRSRRRHAA